MQFKAALGSFKLILSFLIQEHSQRAVPWEGSKLLGGYIQYIENKAVTNFQYKLFIIWLPQSLHTKETGLLEVMVYIQWECAVLNSDCH